MTDGAGWGPYGPPDPYAGTGGYPGPYPADPGERRDPTGGFAVPADPPLTGYPEPGSGAPGRQSYDPAAYGQPASPYPPYSAEPAQPYSDRYSATGYPGYVGGSQPGYVPAQYSPSPPDQYSTSGVYPPGMYPPDGYAAPAYYPGYAAPPPRSRPGSLTAAAVLAFVTAGLDLVGSLAAIGVATEVSGLPEPWWVRYLWVAVVASLAAGGVLIAGGVQALKGRTQLLLAGAAVTAAVALYWFPVFFSSDAGAEVALRMYPPIYLTLAVLMAALARSEAARRWRPPGSWSR